MTPLVERPIGRSDSSSTTNLNDIPFLETKSNSSFTFISDALTTSSLSLSEIAMSQPVRGESYSTKGDKEISGALS